MGELAVLNIAKVLLQQLSSPAKDEFLLWYNSDTELKKLENTIRTIKDVLHDAEQKKAINADIGGWLSRLKDEMYKADDLFDAVSTRALQKKVTLGNKFRKEMKIFFSKSNQFAFIVKISHQVKELRERLDDIAKDINQFGLLRDVNVYDQRHVVKRNEQHSFIASDEVIGREKEKTELLSLLLTDGSVEERVSVIAVVGIGGQGKTALAQLLYNAKETEEFFDLRLWACVNYFSDLKEVLEKITGTGSSSLNELQNRLRAKISGKKFLLVIDDVWDDIREQWLCLKRLLDVGERGSKIVMTTRSEMVAQTLATVRPHYALGELSDEDAWILFKRMAFDNNKEVENRIKLENMGRQIVKKCPNVPLAIRTVGSFLYSKDMKVWKEYVDNELMRAMPDRENIVMQVLKISYEDLPLPVKHCFAYCSLFPQDHLFDQTTLIHLWMAQGFLETSDENPSLEDVGESYFLYLAQRCFFQNVKVGNDDGIISCKMHDLFHDLAVQVSANECLSMLKINEDLGRKPPRHLLVKDITSSLLECKGMRSLLSPNTGSIDRALLDGVFLNLTSLRTLSLRKLGLEDIPSSIGKLVHLRYLDLMNSDKLLRLPDAFCKLHNLLVLNLEDCWNLIQLPKDLHKLINLRYLQLKDCLKLNHMPSGLEEMTSLVSLDRLIVHKEYGGLRYLKHLNNLTGGITIEFPKGGLKSCAADAEESKLSNKTKLSKLYLWWPSESEEEEFPEADDVLCCLQPSNNVSHFRVYNYPGVKCPHWLSALHNLVELRLWSCNRCHELPQLRHLFQLKTLCLGSMPLLEYVENDMCSYSGSFFPSLEYLDISDMGRLKGWGRPAAGEEVSGVHDYGFPRLSELGVINCQQLATLPLCLFVEALHLDKVSVNLVKQLLRLPSAIELESKRFVAPTSNILHTCSHPSVLSLAITNDLLFSPQETNIMSYVRHLSICDCSNFKRSSLFFLLQQLPSLESLECQGFEATESVIEIENMAKEGMPWRWLLRLKRLNFEFGSDAVGAHLLNGLHYLSGLEELVIIRNVKYDDNMQWTAPPNLKHLSLGDMDTMAGLNRVIHQLKNLPHLTILRCNGVDAHGLNELPWEDLKGLRRLHFIYTISLISIPDRCQHLPALEYLLICGCDDISFLPDWVRGLKSLEIIGCSKLEEKCRKPTGSCWPLIRDIPYLSII